MSWKTVVAIVVLSGVNIVAETDLLASDLYQWTDSKGVVHYGDRPPADKPFLRLQRVMPPLNGGPVPGAVRAQRRAEKRSASSGGRERAVRHGPTSAGPRAEARQARECARLRARIKTIEDQMRNGYREPRGNRLRQQRRRWSEQLYRDCYG